MQAERPVSSPLLSILALACASSAAAQAPDFLFTTLQPEQTRSGSGGTVLADLAPEEIVHLGFSAGCSGLSAEKWVPRTCFHTMAGDTDGDDGYWEPVLFDRIDALVMTALPGPANTWNPRTVYYSPSQAMGTCVSGAPGLRPGDVGRIVRDSSGADGQVEYFLRAEHVQSALGLPPTPVVVDVDACTGSRQFGVFFSLENDRPVSTVCGTTMVRDGDVLVIPQAAITWNPDDTVAAVMPGSALVAYDETAMDTFVQNAKVTDRNGVCATQIIDVDALEISWTGTVATGISSCYGVAATIPHLLFAGERLTGASVLDTTAGGSIHAGPCGPLGTSCGSGPTFGDQMGLRPTSTTQGVPSSVNGLTATRVCRFVTESPAPQIPVFTPVQLDIGSPGAWTWVFYAVAPGGPCAVAPSTPFWMSTFCFPDYYAAPSFMGTVPTGTGFGTFTSPPVPVPLDLVWFGVTVSGGGIGISTPSTVEVF